MNLRTSALVVALGFAIASPILQAQGPKANPTSPAAPNPADEEAKAFEKRLNELGAQREGVGKIGSVAEIAVPPGYVFLPPSGARTMLQDMGNLTSGKEAGLLMNEAQGWFVAFMFNDDGYVKDDEKDKLDPDAILKQLKEMQEAGNEQRKKQGMPAQHYTGWTIPPHYDEHTQNLEWAIRFTRDGSPGETVNHRSKVLGRSGAMDVILVCNPEELDGVLPTFRKVMENYHYIQGETYAEYRKGDKLATYGLIGAVAGGAAFAAGKAGLFGFIAKGGKAVIVGILAVFAAIGKFFKNLFGRKDSTYQQ